MTRTTLAPLAIVTAMLLFAVGDNFVPALAESMSVWQFHAVRAALILPFMVAGLALAGHLRTIAVQRPRAVAARSVFAISALVLYFGALPAIGVSLAAAGLFTSPIFVVVISVLFFGERVGIRRITAMLIGFIGVCLVLGIGAEPLRAMAVLPMVGGALYALSILWTRRYCQQENAGALAIWNMTTFLIFGSIGMMLSPWIAEIIGPVDGTAFLVRPPAWPPAEAWIILLGIGAGAGIGMVLLAWGYRSADSTFAALFDYSFLVWAPLFAWLIQGEVIAPRMALGMALIIGAGWLAATGLARQGRAAS